MTLSDAACDKLESITHIRQKDAKKMEVSLFIPFFLRNFASENKRENMKIGIIVAMDKEFTQLRTLLDDSRTERKNGKDFVIGDLDTHRLTDDGQPLTHQLIMQQCGIGKVNAAIGAVEMINNYKPDLVISTGVAGGADVNMNPLDIVVGTRYYYHDVYCGSEVQLGQFVGLPPFFVAPNQLVEAAQASNEQQPTPNNQQPSSILHAGPIVSGDWFVDSREKMQSILENFPDAKAVDMESCSIAQTCYIYKTPFISFRIISDVPLKDEKAAQYFDFWNRMAEGSFNATRRFLMNI